MIEQTTPSQTDVKKMFRHITDATNFESALIKVFPPVVAQERNQLNRNTSCYLKFPKETLLEKSVVNQSNI